MHLSENEGIEGNRFVVTGGLGFVGSALCLELVRRGAEEVRSFDARSCSPWSPDLQKNGVRCIQGDVSQKMNLKEALKGANCVFHLASYGMSGKEMLQASRIDEVNLNGTCNVLDVCHEVGIKRLVYVSTYNVVFGGKEIVNGNESLPYYPIDDHVDPYGCSKSIAEQLVLKSNGSPSKKRSGVRLYTCAIRPAAIYGPGEQRHFPRILSLAQMGLAFFRVGDASVKTDWVYVDNLVLALILASMGLLDDIPGRKGHPIAAGQAYFISDGSPVNTFNSIINPLFKSLDYDVPKFTISVKHALLMSRICWFICMLLFPWLNHPWVPGPLLLPAEVYKVKEVIEVGPFISQYLALNRQDSPPLSTSGRDLQLTSNNRALHQKISPPLNKATIYNGLHQGHTSTLVLPILWRNKLYKGSRPTPQREGDLCKFLAHQVFSTRKKTSPSTHFSSPLGRFAQEAEILYLYNIVKSLILIQNLLFFQYSDILALLYL